MSKVKAWTCSTAWNDEKDSVPVEIYTDKSKAEKKPCLKYDDDGHCYLVELEIEVAGH